ncbi:MAG: FHA domain-containing protein, partial [Quisquiliibacterium sp.]
MLLTLIIEADGEQPRTVAVTEFPCRIGRHKSAEVVLGSWRVARWHAEIHRLDGGFKLLDLGSIGGTWVNGERIVEYAPLSDSDEIVISGYRIKPLPSAGAHLRGVMESASHVGHSTPRMQDPAQSARWRGGLLSRDGVGCGEPSSPLGFARSFATASVVGADSMSLRSDSADGDRGVADAIGQGRSDRQIIEASQATVGVLPLATMEWRRLLHHRLLQTIDLRRKDVRQLSADQLRGEAAEILREIIAREGDRPAGVDIERAIE